MEVNRGNKKLLERLVEISKGKHVSDLIRLINLALCGASDPRHGHRFPKPSFLNVLGVFPPEVAESGSKEARNPVDRAGELQIREETVRVTGGYINQGPQDEL